MTPSIASIESLGPGLRARRIVFDDFTERTTAGAVVRTLGLAEGDAVSADELEESLAKLEPVMAREWALRLLGHRERSVSELTQRLTQGGFPRTTASAVVESLKRSGLVDDERFAEVWARSRVASGYGYRRIRNELLERGISAELSEAALDAALDGASELERARALVGEPQRRDRRDRERLLRRLVSKGFDLSVAARALDMDTPLSSENADFSSD